MYPCNLAGHGADGQLSVGKELWLFQSKVNNGVCNATVDVLCYSNGRSNHLEVGCLMLMIHLVGFSFEEFPSKHSLHMMCNRNTVKVNYSCIPNVRQTFDEHSKSKLSKSPATHNKTACNCQKKTECPLSIKCKTKSVIYQVTVII